MSAPADPRCPECGGPIGSTATYCMHCSADLTDELEAADADGDGAWDRARAATTSSDAVTSSGATASTTAPSSAADEGGGLLAPDGLVDDTLTVVVGVAGGMVVGLVGTFVLLILIGNAVALGFGLVAWLGSTAYLVRRRTVQGAVAKTGYAVSVVLLLVPLIAFSPFAEVDGGVGARAVLFVVLLVLVAVPAAFAAVVGWIAARFVPGDG